MGGEGNILANPFVDPPKPDPLRTYRPLSATELVSLHRAPRLMGSGPGPWRRRGTDVTVWAKPVREVKNLPDHMFEVFDDGHRQFIARAGPNVHGSENFLAAGLAGTLSVRAQVDPAERSPDYKQGRRVVARGFLPDVSAREATAPARTHAVGVNRGGNAYRPWRNSNSYAADVFEDVFGYRPGDNRTWGYRTRLTDDPGLPDLSYITPSLPRIIRNTGR